MSRTLRCIRGGAGGAGGLQLPFTKVSPGVYTLMYGLTAMRLIVIHALPWRPVNAPLLFFSADARAVDYARTVFVPRSPEMCTGLLDEVLFMYQLEGVNMPFTAEDFMREHTRNVLSRLTPEERLKGLPPETVLKQYAAEERLRGLPPEEMLRSLTPEARVQLEVLILSQAGKDVT